MTKSTREKGVEDELRQVERLFSNAWGFVDVTERLVHRLQIASNRRRLMLKTPEQVLEAKLDHQRVATKCQQARQVFMDLVYEIGRVAGELPESTIGQ